MNLDDAIEIHREWKLKLRRALITKEILDEATITADNRCTLGQWLNGEAKQRFGKLKSYADCVENMRSFIAVPDRLPSLSIPESMPKQKTCWRQTLNI